MSKTSKTSRYEIWCRAECAKDLEMTFAYITDINIGRRNSSLYLDGSADEGGNGGKHVCQTPPCGPWHAREQCRRRATGTDQLTGVTKRFVTPSGTMFTALRDVDMTIGAGKFCAVEPGQAAHARRELVERLHQWIDVTRQRAVSRNADDVCMLGHGKVCVPPTMEWRPVQHVTCRTCCTECMRQASRLKRRAACRAVPGRWFAAGRAARSG